MCIFIYIQLCKRPICVSFNNHQGDSNLFILVVIDYNPSHESLCKPLTNIARVVWKIGSANSPDIIIITPEKVVAAIDQVDHDIPTIFS